MNKYSKKIIYDYINGNNIEEYDKEKLEKDSKFMKLVISITRDKNIYDKCPEELKKDHDFIKHIIITFNTDIAFISKVMDDYINISKNLETFTELIILMCKYTKNNETSFNKYEKYRELIYLDFKVKIALAKQEYIGTNIEREIGMGFIFIFDYFNHSKITLNYFASNFIEDIFNENNLDFEELIHNNFKTFKDLEDYGINKYLFNFIDKYDSSLSNYATTNRVVIKSLLNKLNKIKAQWELYPEKKLQKQYELMFEKVFDYMSDIDNSTLAEVELIYYLAQELGITETLKKYDMFMQDELYELIISTMDDKIKNAKFNMYDIKYINDVKNIIIDTLELSENINNNTLKQRVMKKVLIKNNKQDN